MDALLNITRNVTDALSNGTEMFSTTSTITTTTISTPTMAELRFDRNFAITVPVFTILMLMFVCAMFDEDESVSNVNQAKSSVMRSVKASIIERYPQAEGYINDILPKKEQLYVIKCHDHIELLSNSAGHVLFFKHYDGPYMPALKLLHKYPFILPRMQVDKGAIRFVLSGANIMCPGLTSPGACMTDLEKDSVVAVVAEGKTHALGIGLMKMSSKEIKSKNKGIGVDTIHYLNDGLWKMKPVKR